jgi:hypothetical protein
LRPKSKTRGDTLHTATEPARLAPDLPGCEVLSKLMIAFCRLQRP